MAGVTWLYTAPMPPISCPSRWCWRTSGTPPSIIARLWECRASPCGVIPGAIGSQVISERLRGDRPRTGIPGQGSASSGTGRSSWTSPWPFLAPGYRPVDAAPMSHGL